jgi:glycosyltransferase involved in cell wall biosynthesis
LNSKSVNKPPVRVLYVEGNPDGTIGGSFFSLLHLVENLDRSQFDPVVAFAANNSLVDRFRGAGATVIIRPMARPVVWTGVVARGFAKIANFLVGFVVEPLRLARLMSRESIGLVHLNNSIIRNHAWGVAALYARIPCLTHERGINARYSKRSLWLARRYRAVICISTAVHDSLVQGGASEWNLRVIPNGLDPAVMRACRTPDEMRRNHGIGNGARVIGMVGNIKPWKGQEIVVRAIARLREEIPDIVCLLVGDCAAADIEYYNHLQELVARLDLREHVIFARFQANVAEYIAAMEILVHASIAPEPFGRVLLEGMAMRKPLVASRDGAIAEIVVDRVTGLLFAPGDPAELSDRLHDLLSDPGRARQMGDAGHARLLENFHVRRNVALTVGLYRQILGKC